MELKSSFQYPKYSETPHLDWVARLSAQIATADRVFRAGLSWIIHLGIQTEMPFYLKNNLIMINLGAFVCLLLALPGSFLLMLAGFQHSFSLLLLGVVLSSLVLGLNAAHIVQWAQALYAFAPAAVTLTYTLFELSSGYLTDPLLYVLARQGLVLALLLPILIYGFEKSQKWITLGECVIVLFVFDIACVKTGYLVIVSSMQMGLFTILSVFQFALMAASILYMQSNSLEHAHQVDQSTQKWQNLAIRDGLTGAFNRSFIEGLIGDAINRTKRSNASLSLLMIDVDRFKQVNDTHGHRLGDEVLTSLVKLIEGSKRSTDYLGRWGGDELILLLTGTDLRGAQLLAEKLRTRVENNVFPHNTHLTISLGASTYQAGENQANFIERADAAMYQAKRSGRNRVGSGVPN